MFFRWWLDLLERVSITFQDSPHKRWRRYLSYGLAIERLEERWVPSGASPASEKALQAFGQVPLSFEQNQGQTDPQVKFLSRGSGQGTSSRQHKRTWLRRRQKCRGRAMC